MKEEYCFNLTVPIEDVEKARALLDTAREKTPAMRISRKPDRKQLARFYLSFPFSGTRIDQSFEKWFTPQMPKNWELFGPHYGRWGLS